MEVGECAMAVGECAMAVGDCPMTVGECEMADSDRPMSVGEVSLGVGTLASVEDTLDMRATPQPDDAHVGDSQTGSWSLEADLIGQQRNKTLILQGE
jgi:hypothetical protein